MIRRAFIALSFATLLSGCPGEATPPGANPATPPTGEPPAAPASFSPGKGAHPNLVPVATDGIPTYKNGNAVGNMVFRGTFIEKDDAKPADLWGGTLDFPQGAPPAEWWGRSYLPCTLGEAIESIDFESRAHRLVTKVYLTGASLPKDLTLRDTGMDMTDKERDWNTVSFEGASAEEAKVNDQLKTLEKGRYKLIIWRQLDYEMHVEYVDTKTTGWEPRWTALSKGTLEIEVR